MVDSSYHVARTFIVGILTLYLVGVCHSQTPVFGNYPASKYITVSEAFPNGSLLLNFTVSHPTSDVTVNAVGYYTTSLVHISQTEGKNISVNVTTTEILDRDGNGQPGTSPVDLQFVAKDKSNNEIVLVIKLYITDVNDNAPVFQDEPYTWEIKELPYYGNASEAYTIISATDRDSGDFGKVSYSMAPKTQSASAAADYMRTFKIDPNTGVVQLMRNLDYETNSFYQFRVIAMDNLGNGLNSTADFVIRVLDVQDQPPFFVGQPYRITITENVTYGIIKTVTARDGDTGLSNPVGYSIQQGPCSSFFAISENGSISTVGPLDRENNEITKVSGVCVLKVVAHEVDEHSDDQHGDTNTTTEVTITIEDVDDNVPEFTNTVFHATVLENTPRNVPITLTNLTEIRVFDADQDSFAEIDLHLEYPNKSVCKDFEVSPNFVRKNGSVLIRVVNQNLLDFEETQQITFLIIANGHANRNFSASATIFLTIEDMNDNNPHFTNSSYKFTTIENSPKDICVGTIKATDRDSDEYKPITYSLSGGNNKFAVNVSTGDITTFCDKECLDRERTSVYYLTITATDKGGRSNSTSVEIELTDANDNSPKFSREQYAVFIQENKTYDTAIIETEASDIDEMDTNNSKIMYSIANCSDLSVSGKFNITENGLIFLLSPVDYEELNDSLGGVFILTIEAKDFGQPQKTGIATVKITVQDMNDNLPVFTSSVFSAKITENSTSTITDRVQLNSGKEKYTIVTTVKADDMDSTPQNKHLQYFITAGAMDMFRINSSNGSVSVQINAKLDRERTSNYNITVIAIDQGSPPLTGTTSLLIEIMDVNDEFPVFNKTAYTVDVKENQTASETGCVVQATDADIDHNLLYRIVNVEARDETGKEVNSSLVKNYFQIHSDNGSVYIIAPPDREVAKTITLTVEVNDTNAYHPSPQTANAKVTINLIDVNDNYPEFEKPNYSVNVSENAQNPTILLTIGATDKDENRTITYELHKTTNFSDSFSVDAKTGVLSKTGVLDRETSDKVLLNISATDSGVPSLVSTTQVIVLVMDFNDNAPNFGNLPSVINVTENETNGTLILKVTATDEDIGPNANVTFSFENENSLFYLDLVSGNLSVIGVLDRETTDVHILRIVARDNPLEPKERKSSTHVLQINIVDINDNAPIFSSANYTASILENVNIGTNVIQVSAKDADYGNNSLVRYFLNSSTTNFFKIHETSGQISVNSSLIGQTGWHVLQLIAKDLGKPEMANSSVVYIEILDVNLNAPVITNPPSNGTIKVYECVNSGHIIYDFNYTDADSGVNAMVVFTISEIDGGDSILNTFEMLSNGSLTLKIKLNAAAKSSYKFQVQVTDKGTPALSSEKMTVTVKVIDVNDNPPSFDKENITFYLEENKNHQAVGTVTAIDPDRDSVNCYEIEEQNSGFEVGENNGTIVNIRPFDFETTRSVSFYVLVKDCSINMNISECDDLNAVTPNPGETRREKIRVDIRVTDVNDNPPVFKQKEIAIGMSRKTEVGKTLDISLKTSDYVEDNDTLLHGRMSWIFKNNGEIELSESLSSIKGEGVHDCQDNKKHIICVTGNGSLINNKYYNEDLSGYIILPVNVSDEAGSDSANIRIYLIADSQILIMTLLGMKEIVAERKNDIMKLYSAVTGFQFVYDWLEDHKTPSGKVDIYKTDLYFHIVDPVTNRILSSSEAIKIVDENYEKLLQAMQQYDVLQIISSQQVAAEDDSPTKTIYILAAIIALLALTVAVIVYVSLTTRSTYKRKLKAATVNPNDLKDTTIKDDGFIPGSNLYCKLSNPLLNAELPQPHAEYDNISMGSNNSLDENSIGDPRKESERDGMEEREVRMDMYMEDTEGPVESPLDAALRLHDMQNREKKGTDSTDTIISPESMENLVFENAAYVGNFESTEI